MVGRSLITFVDPKDKERVSDMFRRGSTRDSGIISIDFPFTHKDGREIFIHIRSSHLFDDSGMQTGYRGVARDVTDLIRSMEALQEQTRQVEQLSEQKDLFLNQLAHDLRTPLTPIIGMAPYLLEGITDPDARELITIFLKSIQYLQKISEDILVTTSLNRANYIDSFETYDLSDLIADAIGANQYLADQKELNFVNTVIPGTALSLSKTYANLLFRNIINNAVKYNTPRGTVTISPSFKERTVVISITDTGIGISPDIQNKIWDELYIGDLSRNDPLSKGLGLPIGKRIIELHHGTVEVFSKGYVKGSTFTVILPVADDNRDG